MMEAGIRMRAKHRANANVPERENFSRQNRKEGEEGKGDAFVRD